MIPVHPNHYLDQRHATWAEAEQRGLVRYDAVERVVLVDPSAAEIVTTLTHGLRPTVPLQ